MSRNESIFLGCVWVACGLACLATKNAEPLGVAGAITFWSFIF